MINDKQISALYTNFGFISAQFMLGIISLIFSRLISVKTQMETETGFENKFKWILLQEDMCDTGG